MDPSMFDYFERLMICLSPLAVAWLGVQSSRNEKQTKKYMESQQQLKEANDKLEAKNREEIQRKLDSLGSTMESMKQQIEGLESKVASLTIMDQKIERLVEMSNVNHEFCLSLSQLVSAIGNALDSSTGINSGNLPVEMQRHQNLERQLATRTGKIIY